MRSSALWGRFLLPALSHRKEPIVEMSSPRPPLPQRVRKTPVTEGVHLAEGMLAKYRVLAERLRTHLEGPEAELLDMEVRFTHCEVTEALRDIGKETYGGASK
jgi:hypothetical protein